MWQTINKTASQDGTVYPSLHAGVYEGSNHF
jgi:hypothetical protein